MRIFERVENRLHELRTVRPDTIRSNTTLSTAINHLRTIFERSMRETKNVVSLSWAHLAGWRN